MSSSENFYGETELVVQEAASKAIRYIVEGWGNPPTVNIKGLCVFGVIAALRENDEVFYGNPGLNPDQQNRLEEVESVIEGAVQQRLHYYPFGHDADRYSIDYSRHTGDRDDRQRALTARSGPFRASKNSRGTRRGRKYHYDEGGRIALGKTKPVPVFEVIVRNINKDKG